MSLRDYAEDRTHENGRYHNTCVRCGNQFVGHKRRVMCKCCHVYLTKEISQDEEEKCGECGGSGWSYRQGLDTAGPLRRHACPVCAGSGKATGEKK